VREEKLFREAFLLSESGLAKNALAELYKKIGFEMNSEFYKSL